MDEILIDPSSGRGNASDGWCPRLPEPIRANGSGDCDRSNPDGTWNVHRFLSESLGFLHRPRVEIAPAGADGINGILGTTGPNKRQHPGCFEQPGCF
jgi:hypothetical protein